MKRRRLAITLALFICLLPLAVLGWHLWTYEYQLERGGGAGGPRALPQPPSGRLEVLLKLSAERFQPKEEVRALVLLRNRFPARLRLLDAANTDQLFALELQRLLPEGKLEPLRPHLGARSRPFAQKSSDPAGVAVVELLPGAFYGRELSLSTLFPLKEPGRYRLRVTYGAEKFAQQAPQAFPPGTRWQGTAASEAVEFEVTAAPTKPQPAARPP